MQSTKAIVVGAGIGGIATAIRLAVKGFEVEVHEKNEVAGGKLYLIEKDGFSFDAGPSLFTQPANVEELFSLAGEDISNYFTYEPVSVACRYFFENGKKLDAFTNPQAFANEMQRVVDALRTVRFPYLFKTLDGFNRSRFVTPEAVQVFNRFATYNGSNPFSAPGMLSLIPHLEQNQGTYYPHGGMINIPNALIALAEKKGVRFVLNSHVEKIVTAQGSTTGIIANGSFVPANMVISNVDAYFTYKKLLADEQGARKILRNERSSSALIFYWGMKREFSELHLHNILFSAFYEKEFDCLFKEKKFHDDPTIYINISSKMEKGHAPEGNENWFVMVNAPAMDGADWQLETARVRKNILIKLNRMLGADIEQDIVVEEVLTPGGIQARTDSYLGSLYGTSSNSKWAAFLRHANFTSKTSGLYFTGGSVHPGGGIPLCLKSAAIVSDLIGNPA